MKKKGSRVLPALAIVIVIGVSSIASAQMSDVFWTNYFSNNTASGAADSTLRITNPGVRGGNRGSFAKPGPGSLCAMIYVYRSNQTINECCGCLVTPNGLQTISVQTQLTANTLTGVVPNNGTIEVISAGVNTNSSATSVAGMFPLGQPYSLNNSIYCDPSASYVPTPNLRAWMTHVQLDTTGSPETETGALPTPLSAGEEGWLQGVCNFAITQGSGQGVCDCGTFEK